MNRELAGVMEPMNCDVSVECVRIKEEQDNSKELALITKEHDMNCNVNLECLQVKKEWEHMTREVPGANEKRDCMNVDCVRTKEGMQVNDESACVNNPEWPNSMNDLVCVKTEDECASEMGEWDGGIVDGVEMGLYLGHEVKRELVLGPEELQMQDIAFRLNALNTAKIKQEPTHLATRNPCETTSQSYKEIGLKTCFIKLQRIDNMLTFHQKLSIGIHKIDTDINIERIKKEKAYSCDTCGEQFELKTSLITHVKEHNLEKHESHLQISNRNLKKKKYQPKKRLFICDYCSKQFWLRQAIATHLRTHTGEKPFKCQKCNKKFTDMSTLIRHRRVHTGEKPYSCDTCNKRFNEKYLLRNHRRIHTGEIRYSCKFCNKPFNHISNLARHERTHVEKPFECDFCSWRFNVEATFNKHILTHMRVKEHVCGVCERSYHQSSHLRRHLASHVTKPFLCGVCKAQFTQRSTLLRHQGRQICGKQAAKSCEKATRYNQKDNLYEIKEKVTDIDAQLELLELQYKS